MLYPCVYIECAYPMADVIITLVFYLVLEVTKGHHLDDLSRLNYIAGRFPCVIGLSLKFNEDINNLIRMSFMESL